MTPLRKNRILVIGNRLLGDGLDSFPALYLLFNGLPQSIRKETTIDLLINRYTRSLYRNFPFDRVFILNQEGDYLDKKNLWTAGKRGFRLWRDLRRKYSVICVFPGGFGWALWAFLLGAKRIIGHIQDYRGLFLTHGVVYSRSHPNYKNFFPLAEKVVSLFSPYSSLTSKNGQMDQIRKALPDLVPQSPWKVKTAAMIGKKSILSNYVVISPTASERNKTWAGVNFFEIACKLWKRGYHIFWVGVGREFYQIESIRAGDKKPIGYNLAGKLELEEVFGLIKDSCGFIGNDSGLAHAAAMLAITSAVIYGPGNPTLSRPLSGIIGRKKNGIFCPIYQEFQDIPHHLRREKRYNKTLNINLVSASEVWEKIEIYFPALKKS